MTDLGIIIFKVATAHAPLEVISSWCQRAITARSHRFAQSASASQAMCCTRMDSATGRTRGAPVNLDKCWSTRRLAWRCPANAADSTSPSRTPATKSAVVDRVPLDKLSSTTTTYDPLSTGWVTTERAVAWVQPRIPKNANLWRRIWAAKTPLEWRWSTILATNFTRRDLVWRVSYYTSSTKIENNFFFL